MEGSQSISSDKQDILNFIEQLLINNEKIILVLDFDQTISLDGLSKGEDPRDSQIDPVVKDALIRIKKSEVDVAILSARSGQKIVEIIQIPDTIIVGTLGWETYTLGVSFVSEHFLAFKDQITKILKHIRESFSKKKWVGSEIEIEIDLGKDGKIILERKAVSNLYPEGIMHNYNLNMVNPEKRADLVDLLSKYYFEVIDSLKETPEFINELKRKCGLIPDDHSPEKEGWYSFQIGPISQQAKAHGLIQLMREPNDPKRESYFKNLPGGFTHLIYFGDSNFDIAAMQAGHNEESLTKGYIDLTGVLIEEGEEAVKKELADFKIRGVSANAQLLDEIAALVDKYHP